MKAIFKTLCGCEQVMEIGFDNCKTPPDLYKLPLLRHTPITNIRNLHEQIRVRTFILDHIDGAGDWNRTPVYVEVP
ncbi:MAG: hypothetical protein WCS52_02010 [bacterium]